MKHQWSLFRPRQKRRKFTEYCYVARSTSSWLWDRTLYDERAGIWSMLYKSPDGILTLYRWVNIKVGEYEVRRVGPTKSGTSTSSPCCSNMWGWEIVFGLVGKVIAGAFRSKWRGESVVGTKSPLPPSKFMTPTWPVDRAATNAGRSPVDETVSCGVDSDPSGWMMNDCTAPIGETSLTELRSCKLGANE